MTELENNLLIERILRHRTESQSLELKSAKGGVPMNALRESISAFANSAGGGQIVLGIEEGDPFRVVGVLNLHQLQSEIGNIARDQLTPPVPVRLTPHTHSGSDLLIVSVPETPLAQKPCYISARGVQNGSFIRVGPSNRKLTTSEIFDFQVFQLRQTFDDRPVEAGQPEDLSRRRVDSYILSLQTGSNRDYNRVSYDDALTMFRIASELPDESIQPTLAGLICFSDYPQRVLPQQRIVFTQYWGNTTTERTPEGGRYVDNRYFEGPASEMISSAENAIRNSLPLATHVRGILNERVPTFPTNVIRELLTNAVAHRDYGPFSIGSNIRINLFRDRLEIRSPGGLFGGVSLGSLEAGQSTRNPLLMRFLEDLGIVENRGGGIDEVVAELRSAGLPHPTFAQEFGWFQVTLPRPDAEFHPEIVPDRQVQEASGSPILDYLYQHGQITNRETRNLLGLSDDQAVRLLRSMTDQGLIELHGKGRGAHYLPINRDNR